MKQKLIKIKDLDLGIDYAYLFSEQDCKDILDAAPGDLIELEGGRGSVIVNRETIICRIPTDSASFDKKEFLSQISNHPWLAEDE